MDARRSTFRLPFAVLGGIGLLLFLTVVPLCPCNVCGEKRSEINDWLAEPYLKQYRDTHPEAVTLARTELAALNNSCQSCFHGKISLYHYAAFKWKTQWSPLRGQR